MTRAETLKYAQDWIANWNRRDLEAVLAHFADDVRFHSPKAEMLAGKAEVVGKPALRAYWTQALAKLPSLHFTFEHLAWDDAARELALYYIADVEGLKVRACEVARFDAQGRVVYGAAYYGGQV